MFSSASETHMQRLRARLSTKTFDHCISTALFVKSFFNEAGIDEDKAEQAGLLHDMCKNMKPEELLQAARMYGLEINDTQLASPGLLHGPVAAEMCRRDFGITDPEVIEAIQWHTTGRPGLCRLGQALYFADFAEPGRDFAEAIEARRILAQEGFEPALRYVAKRKVDRIHKKPHADPISIAFCDWLHRESA